MTAEAELSPMDIATLLQQGEGQPTNLQDDLFLQELMTSQQVDFLDSIYGGSAEATLQDSHGQLLEAPLDFESLLNLPTSPVTSEGCTSETSSTTNLNRLDSPTASLVSAGGSGLISEQAESPHNHSPLITPGFSDPSQWSPMSDAAKRNSGSDFSSVWSASPSNHLDMLSSMDRVTDSTSDVRIDVDSLRASASVTTPSSPSSPSSRKAATLVLSEEEKRLLSEEGIDLPTDMPLTKAEQKDLKRVQRKIKNKISAHESRKRKKEYVEGLEDRVKLSTERNQHLTKQVDRLQSENKSLAKQLRDLQDLVSSLFPSKLQAGTAGTMLMVMALSFSLFMLPSDKGGYQVANGYARQTRNLLFTETDQFGNVVDPTTGKIITVAGGHTPFPLPPWLDQTPAILQWMNSTRLTDTARRMFSRPPAEPEGGAPEVVTPQQNLRL